MLDADYCEIRVGGHYANSQCYVALVDAADLDMVSAYRWSRDGKGYAKRTIQVGGKQLAVFMHRAILGLDRDDPRQVDHVSGDKLDNRRANLRVCTRTQNAQNLHHCGHHRGTSWHAGNKSWQAEAQVAKKRYHLGYFHIREEAAAAASAFRRQHMPFSRDAREVT